ncbi:MAG: GDP-mannose 4,6-dehydratase [bacterium]|nr:GDP-mannose 4,6-dehydratase [bacterium]
MYVRNVKDKKYKLIQAEQVFKTINKWQFKKDVLWRGKKKNYFILPSINKYKSQKLEASKKLYIDNWLEFLGWFISEGYTGSGKKGSYRVGISQDKKKSEYRNNIRDCLISLEFKYSENEHEFRVNDKQLWSYLLQFGKAYNKHVPPFIKELPPQQIKIFLDALFKGDGNGKIDTEKNCNFYTSSKKLVNDVQELLLKCGLSGNIKKHKNRDNAYRINVISKYNTPSFRGNTNHVLKYIGYNGEIFCCTVPNHVLYVRRNGKACWSGNSPEYMEAAWLIMQQTKPDDFVIGTGETHSVREFVELAFKEAGLDDWKKYVVIDKKYYRPAEVNMLVADYSKARRILKWQPKTKFKDLVRIMVKADLDNFDK